MPDFTDSAFSLQRRAAGSPGVGARDDDVLQVHLVGAVDCHSAHLLQEQLAAEIAPRSDRFGSLLLCEHPPAISIGREVSRLDVDAEDAELTALRIGIEWRARGGGAILHAPGQLAVYAVLPLERLGFGPLEFRTALENAVLSTCEELRVPAERSGRTAGVECRCGQFAFVAAAANSGVSRYGLAINVSPDMNLQRLIRPRSGSPPIASLAAQRLRPTSMHSVRESIARNLAAEFGYGTVHTHAGHPLLKRTRWKVVLPAAPRPVKAVVRQPSGG